MEAEVGVARLAVSVELDACLVPPLGIAQGGQRLLIADVCRAQSGNLKKKQTTTRVTNTWPVTTGLDLFENKK